MDARDRGPEGPVLRPSPTKAFTRSRPRQALRLYFFFSVCLLTASAAAAIAAAVVAVASTHSVAPELLFMESEKAGVSSTRLIRLISSRRRLPISRVSCDSLRPHGQSSHVLTRYRP